MPKPIIPTINWNNPLTKKMIGNYPIFERGGITITNIVSKIKAATTLPAFSQSIFGNVFNFVAPAAIFNTGLAYTELGTVFTIVQWVNLTSMVGVKVLCSFDNAIMVHVGATDWRWQQDEGAFTNIVCSSTRTANTWYMYAVTKTGTGAGATKLYLNGVQSDNGAAVANPSSGSLVIGQQPGQSRDLVGLSFGPIVWNRALNAQEIKSLYENPWSIYNIPGLLRGP